MPELAGLRALVTGSTRGIGRATAELMALRGAEVLAHGRALSGDLADRDACRRVAAEAGPLDILVNCAGICEERSIEASDEPFWDRTLAVDLTAPWLLARSLLPGLRARRGVIVNVASDAALFGYPGYAVYAAAKGALVGLTKALAVELAPEVRAVCVCPGPVATDMMEEAIARAPDAEAARAAWVRPTLLGRAARPEEIAAVIAFAASPAASFLTGTVIAADGGVSAGRRVAG